MNVTLNNLSPLFLEKEKMAQSQIWQQQLTINIGEKLHVVAPSGSGKTSFIHFLYGLRTDFDGVLQLDNVDSKKISVHELATIRATQMSIVFQDLRLFKTHTVLDNITVKKQLATYPNSASIADMATRLGIGNKLQQIAGTCSYGEQQRIAIIRALQQPFSIIVLDEPFSHLDEVNSLTAMQLITEEADKRGATIILADLQTIPFFTATSTLYL